MASEEDALRLAARGRAEELDKLVSELPGALSVVDRFGRTPLMLAIIHQHEDLALALVHRRPWLNATDHQGFTALMYSCAVGLEEVFEALVEGKADHKLRNKSNHDALGVAASYGRAQLVKALLYLGGQSLTVKDTSGRTVMELAADEACRALLRPEYERQAGRAENAAQRQAREEEVREQRRDHAIVAIGSHVRQGNACLVRGDAYSAMRHFKEAHNMVPRNENYRRAFANAESLVTRLFAGRVLGYSHEEVDPKAERPCRVLLTQTGIEVSYETQVGYLARQLIKVERVYRYDEHMRVRPVDVARPLEIVIDLRGCGMSKQAVEVQEALERERKESGGVLRGSAAIAARQQAQLRRAELGKGDTRITIALADPRRTAATPVGEEPIFTLANESASLESVQQLAHKVRADLEVSRQREAARTREQRLAEEERDRRDLLYKGEDAAA